MINCRALLCLAACSGAVLYSHAQTTPDLAPPKVREKTVTEANRVMETRGAMPSLPTPLPNPFVAKETELALAPVSPGPAAPPAADAALSSADLLARIAARIPSTGTVTLGGEPILLLGQKRLKVGDPYTISFEGQSYDLSIAAITSTSFTVKRGEQIHTRPIRIAPVPTNTPITRP